MEIPVIRLKDAAFRSGDILVHHAWYPDGTPVSPVDVVVAEIGRGSKPLGACHVAMVDATPEGAMVVEMTPPEGRCVPIEDRVKKFPATVHWLRVPGVVALAYDSSERPEVHFYDGAAAVRRMRSYIGRPYGWSTIAKDWLASSWTRWLMHLPNDSEVADWVPVCSVALMDSVQEGFGGWDLERDLNVVAAQPEDVNRVAIFKDMGGLVL